MTTICLRLITNFLPLHDEHLPFPLQYQHFSPARSLPVPWHQRSLPVPSQSEHFIPIAIQN